MRSLTASAACVAIFAFAPTSSADPEPARSEQPAPASVPSPLRTTVTGEIGGGQARPSPDVARSAFYYQKAAARLAPSEQFEVTATTRAFEDLKSTTASSDLVLYGALDGTYQITPSWDVTLGVNGSPKSTREVSTTVTSGNASTEATVRARTSSVGGVVEIGYDSFDADHPHDVDVAIDGGFVLTRYGTEQTVLSSALGSSSGSGLGTQTASLGQARIGATATFTFAEHTDLGLDGAYFVYDTANPGDVGLFDATAGGLTASFGTGLPMLPPRYTLRPEVAQRVGPVTMRAFYQYSSFAVQGAVGHTVGGRLQIALGDVRPYLSASYRADVFPSATGDTWMAGAGVSVRF